MVEPKDYTCCGVDENVVGAYSELVFAPIDEMFPDDAPLRPSGFRIIPLDSKADNTVHRTLDLASSLEVGQSTNRGAGDAPPNACNTWSVLTIAFQFPFENHLQDTVATMARQYVHCDFSVQRVAMAIAPSGLGPHAGPKLSPASPEAQTLAHWICYSYSYHLGAELLRSSGEACHSVLKLLWHHPDAILCCFLKFLGWLFCGGVASLDIVGGFAVDITLCVFAVGLAIVTFLWHLILPFAHCLPLALVLQPSSWLSDMPYCFSVVPKCLWIWSYCRKLGGRGAESSMANQGGSRPGLEEKDWLEMPGSLILLLVVVPNFVVHPLRESWVGVLACVCPWILPTARAHTYKWWL